MDIKLRRLLVILVALVALCGLAALAGSNTPSYAGGPDVTPTCLSCTGNGGTPTPVGTPVANTSSIVGYVYDYSTGPPVPVKDMGVTLTGCSWDAVWGTDDNGHFYFNNLGQGSALVNLQLPPNGHAINPNVLVHTSGMTDTYTVYLGFYVGDQVPLGELKTPDGKSLTSINEQTVTLPPTTTPDGTVMPDVGGTFPDSYLIIGLTAILLLFLPVAGLAELNGLRVPVSPGRRRLTPASAPRHDLQ
jgi:hypothetical protein